MYLEETAHVADVISHTGKITKGAAKTNLTKFPEIPAKMLPDVPSTTTPRGNVKWEPNQNTRIQYHPGEPVKAGDTFNPRHHGPHYHVEGRIDPTKGWNNPGNLFKINPPGYTSGSGTGFLPGEIFPGY